MGCDLSHTPRRRSWSARGSGAAELDPISRCSPYSLLRHLCRWLAGLVPDPPDRGAISLPRQNETYRFCRSQAIADQAADSQHAQQTGLRTAVAGARPSTSIASLRAPTNRSFPMLTRTTAHHATSYPPQWPRSGEIEAKSGSSGSRSKKFRRDFQAPAKPTELARQALSRLNQLFECASKLAACLKRHSCKAQSRNSIKCRRGYWPAHLREVWAPTPLTSPF